MLSDSAEDQNLSEWLLSSHLLIKTRLNKELQQDLFFCSFNTQLKKKVDNFVFAAIYN